MDFSLTQKQLDVQRAVKEFAERELKPFAIENDENSTFPIEAYKKLGELGVIGLPYSTEYGGTGGDYLSYVLAIEEISKVDASMGIAVSVTTSLCAGVISNASEELKKKYLPDILSGKKLGSFGLTEPNAGSDAGGVITVAEKKGDNYILNGAKCFITNAPLS